MAWFNWFKSKEREEVKDKLEKIVEEKIKERREEELPKTPFKNIFYSNNIITVVFHSGIVLTKENVTKEFVLEVSKLQSEEAILGVMKSISSSAEILAKEEAEIQKEVEKTYSTLISSGEFIVEAGKVYLKNIALAIPNVIIEGFVKAVETKDADLLETLKMFWMWTAMCPIESSRNDIYNFLKNNQIPLTKNGLMVMYRRVVKVGNTNKKLTEFVAGEYAKIKRWKKAAKNYTVFKKLNEEEYVLGKGIPDTENTWEDLGNLEEVYLNLPTLAENTYTDSHTKTKKIQIGAVYKEDEDKIDLDNTRDCSSGLHVGSHSFGFGGFGDTGVVALVNPMKVRSVPTSATNKMRVSEMFIVGPYDVHEYGEMAKSNEVIESSQEYFNMGVEELSNMLKDKKFDVISCQDNLPAVTLQDIGNIQNTLKSRVKIIS